MRTLGGFFFALLATTGLFAQSRSGYIVAPSAGGARSVLRPGLGLPPVGAPRAIGSVLNPGAAISTGLGVQRSAPPRRGGAIAYPVAVPVYMGGYGYGGYDVAPEPPPAPAQPQQPNVIVIYPPAPQYSYAPPRSNMVEVPREQMEAREERVEPSHYLLAFKDKSIYSAVAYWVDGETIHYFTAGNTHNQASVSLIDRDLTRRLNDGGLEVKLPAEK